MCEWCESGRLVQKLPYLDQDGEQKTKDWSEYLHEPSGHKPKWWDYQHERALKIVEIEKAKIEAEKAARAGAERREQCRDGDHFVCLNPTCSERLSRRKAAASGFCSKCYQKAKRWEIKYKLIQRLGGSCNDCGVTPETVSLAGFDFHHLDPEDKGFNIGEGINRRWDDLRKEVDKCVLLCANCHRGVESTDNEIVWQTRRARQGRSS